MKRFFVYTVLIGSLFSACQNANSTTDDENEEPKKKISKRDYNITKASSYSDLFFDSTAMEKFMADQNMTDSAARRMRSFYNTRNYQFAWFTSEGLTEQARAFWNLHDYVTTYDNDTTLRDKGLQKKMDALIAEEGLNASASPEFIKTELTLTQHFIRYILNNYEKGYVKRKEMERFIPFKKRDPVEVADSLLNKKHNDDKYFEDVHQPYGRLKEKLALYHSITKMVAGPKPPR